MSTTYFITGIGTDVGKTICAALLSQKLGCHYWKPIQTGNETDTNTLKNLVLNPNVVYHPEAYTLPDPVSPHWAADMQNIQIDIATINRPIIHKDLIIEGAGGVMVPINNRYFIADLIKPTDTVVLVIKHYLGSINHSLLSLEYLSRRFSKICIVFNGPSHPSSESIIEQTFPNTKVWFRIPEINSMNSETLSKIAHQLIFSTIANKTNILFN